MSKPTHKQRRRLVAALRWALPFVLSAAASAFVAWGAVQRAKGAQEQRLATVERDVQSVKSDVASARGEHDQFVRRDAFQLLLDDLKEIKTDVREVRNSLRK